MQKKSPKHKLHRLQHKFSVPENIKQFINVPKKKLIFIITNSGAEIRSYSMKRLKTIGSTYGTSSLLDHSITLIDEMLVLVFSQQIILVKFTRGISTYNLFDTESFMSADFAENHQQLLFSHQKRGIVGLNLAISPPSVTTINSTLVSVKLLRYDKDSNTLLCFGAQGQLVLLHLEKKLILNTLQAGMISPVCYLSTSKILITASSQRTSFGSEYAVMNFVQVSAFGLDRIGKTDSISNGWSEMRHVCQVGDFAYFDVKNEYGIYELVVMHVKSGVNSQRMMLKINNKQLRFFGYCPSTHLFYFIEPNTTLLYAAHEKFVP